MKKVPVTDRRQLAHYDWCYLIQEIMVFLQSLLLQFQQLLVKFLSHFFIHIHLEDNKSTVRPLPRW